MTQILRQSTQVVVRIGVAVAVGDGFTPVTTLDLSTADEAELLKAAGAATSSIAAATFAAITGADGWYNLTLTTTHTDTVGTLDVVVNDDSLILPIYARFQVIEEAVYDAMYAASAPGPLLANSNGSGLTEAGGTGDHLTALATQASVTTIDGIVDAIVADTNELQTDWADGGRLDLLIDAIKASTDNLPTDPADASDVAAAIAALNDLSAAEVNAEVVDALATDTYVETTGVPAATATLAAKLGFLYEVLRNKVTVTDTKMQFFDDADAAQWEKDLSDDGTTYTESEGNAI